MKWINVNDELPDSGQKVLTYAYSALGEFERVEVEE